MKSVFWLLAVLSFAGASFVRAGNVTPTPESGAGRQLIDLTVPLVEQLAVPSHPDLVTVTRADPGLGLDIGVAPGPAAYPGIIFTFAQDAFDLSDLGHIQAKITNTGAQIISVSMRVDNAPSATAPKGTGTGSAYLKPGETGVARVYFAQTGKNSSPIDPARVTKLLLFIGRHTSETRSFRLESITAGGKPGDIPGGAGS